MAVISTGNFAKFLWPGINAIYGMNYKDWKTEYTEIFDTFKSDKAWEEDVGVSSFGLAIQKGEDRKSTRLNSSHTVISYAVFCLKKKTTKSSKYADITRSKNV